MSEELVKAIEDMLYGTEKIGAQYQQRLVIVQDLLWKLSRKDYHGVADCAMDLRELHL